MSKRKPDFLDSMLRERRDAPDLRSGGAFMVVTAPCLTSAELEAREKQYLENPIEIEWREGSADDETSRGLSDNELLALMASGFDDNEIANLATLEFSAAELEQIRQQLTEKGTAS